ncbi:hypothetical protein [uncultured Friedmanniella sp.]|uniref:hypothetical protein n=1 Tax=uncultured Friedmanniella sp. TaxID=335381 RepID=UPI0035CC7479
MTGWTVADIDAALPIVKAKRDQARAAGHLDTAAQHQGWIDRLLDARPSHCAREANAARAAVQR